MVFPVPDMATLRQCSVLASIAYAVAFMVMARGRRDPWMRWWAAASASYGAILIAFEIIGDPVPLVIAAVLNGLIMLSIAMVLAGVRAFDGQRPIAPWMWAVVVATTLVPGIALLFPGPVAVQVGQILLPLTLGIAIAAFGWSLVANDAIDGTRVARQIAGGALLAYVPGYVLASFGGWMTAQQVRLLTLIPMIADQLLQGLANLSLLAIPGLRSQYLLREAAMRDPLTGAWNRAALAVEPPVPGRIVLLVDVDHFKAINDAHGHATGDRVLVAIVAALRACAAGAFVARLGGDEFLVIADGEDPAAIADQVRKYASRPVVDLPAWTVSVGVTPVEPGDATLAEAIQRADGLMYRAKGDGRGRIAA
jgi:diguanylate cyclase (GGDEF)-like protein